MRLAACAGLLLLTIAFLGCGDGGSGGATASAGAAPPAPGGPPAGPPAPGSDAPPGGPSPDAPAAETPPPAETPPATLPGDTPPDAPQQPGGSSDGGGSTEGGQPGGGQFDGGQQPGGDPNDPNANPDGTPRRPPPPRNLREQAYAAFRSGNDLQGYKLLNAHYGFAPTAKNELGQKMAWIPGLMRPGLAPRIGIAVFYEHIPLNFKGNPMPIGSAELTTAVDAIQSAEQKDTRIGGNRRQSKFARGSRGPMSDVTERAKGDPNANLPAPQQLSFYLGEFGETFHDALLDRFENGDYGPVIQDLMRQASRPTQRGRNASGQDGNPGDGQPGDASGEQPGQPVGGRGGRGGGGSGNAIAGGLPGLEDGDENKPRRFSSKASDKEAANLANVKQLTPCVIWLGMSETRDDLTKRAEAANCDILAVFHMTLREARTTNLINNTTLLRIHNLRTGKPLTGYAPEPLINLTVETWRQKEEKGTDPVEKEIIKAIEALDKALKPVPLPEAVTAERAKKRIADLAAQKPDDPLPIIVEARFYAAKGLMTDTESEDTAKSLLGDAGFEKLKARAKEGE